MTERAIRAVGAAAFFFLCSFGAVGCMSTDGLAGGGGAPNGTAAASGDEGSGPAASNDGGARTVFVTSQVFPAALGGYAGADAKCQTAADASSLASMRGRRWGAILAGSSTTLAEASWSMPNGDAVAATTEELLTGKLETELASDENGSVRMYTDPRDVWTGGAVGQAQATVSTCAGWTAASAASAIVGHPIDTDTTWDLGPAPCTTSQHLYCAEL